MRRRRQVIAAAVALLRHQQEQGAAKVPTPTSAAPKRPAWLPSPEVARARERQRADQARRASDRQSLEREAQEERERAATAEGEAERAKARVREIERAAGSMKREHATYEEGRIEREEQTRRLEREVRDLLQYKSDNDARNEERDRELAAKLSELSARRSAGGRPSSAQVKAWSAGRDWLLTYTAPEQKTVGAVAADIAGAGAATFRRITISVPSAADTGIYLNPAGTATTSHFLLQPGGSRSYDTNQAISAIRAGAADVTAYVQVGTAS